MSIWGPGPPRWGSGSARLQAPEAELQNEARAAAHLSLRELPLHPLQWRSGPRVKLQAPRPDLAWPRPGGGVWPLQLGDPVGWGPCTNRTRRLASVPGRRAVHWLILVAPGQSWPRVTPPHAPVCFHSALGDHACTLFESSSHGETSYQASKLGPLQTPPQPCARWLRPTAV